MSQVLSIQVQISALRDELALMASLQDDWDSYGAEAPSAPSRDLADDMLGIFGSRQALPSTVVPSAEGGVALYFMKEDATAYVEYRNSGEAVLAMYRSSGRPEIKFFDPELEKAVVVDAVISYLA